VFVVAFGISGLAGSAAAAPSTQDTAWMVAAHQSNLAEIAAGNAAVAQGTSAGVKRLGAMFVEMHTKLDADLTSAASTLNVQLPTSPSAAQQQQLAAVTAKSGADFDTAWLAQQTAAHQDTLQATKTETATGTAQAMDSVNADTRSLPRFGSDAAYSCDRR
jgi:putative membrane protein